MQRYCRLAICIMVLPGLVWAAAIGSNWDVTVPEQTICNVQGDGSGFGYSLSISTDDSSGFSWLAVGRPWDYSVNVYIARNPTRYLSASQGAAPRWTLVNRIVDTGYPTFYPTGLSYFGYSVSLTQDGAWLAVGIPGRKNTAGAVTDLEDTPYEGAVRLYRRQDNLNSRTINPNAQYTLVTEVPDPNVANRLLDHFGSKVVLKIRPRSNNDTWMVVNNNHGWDGTRIRTPNTDFSRAGLYIYRLVNYDALSGSGSATNWQRTVNYTQFIPIQAKIPLGTIGTEFEVLEVPEESTLRIYVRDMVLSPALNNTQRVTAAPSGFWYSTLGGRTTLIGPVGAVLEYTLNTTSWRFEQTNQQLMSYGFRYDTFVYNPGAFNYGYGRDDPAHNDWFGASLAVTRDASANRYVAAVAAPRAGDGVFMFARGIDSSDFSGYALQDLTYAVNGTYVPPYNEVNTQLANVNWNGTSFVRNPAFWRRTYYGGRMAFSPNGKFLLVSDPFGSSDNQGRGKTYLYWRRAIVEGLVPARVARGVAFGRRSPSGVQYDMLQTYKKVANASRPTSFNADHFGQALAVNNWFAIIGAALESCIYSYPMPQTVVAGAEGYEAVDFEGVGLVNITRIVEPPRQVQSNVTRIPQIVTTFRIPQFTTTPYTPSTIFREENIVPTTPAQTWLYTLLAVIGILVVVLPLIGYALYQHQRKKMMKQLQGAQSMNTATASAFAAAADGDTIQSQ